MDCGHPGPGNCIPGISRKTVTDKEPGFRAARGMVQIEHIFADAALLNEGIAHVGQAPHCTVRHAAWPQRSRSI
jgi:hypothetical protein